MKMIKAIVISLVFISVVEWSITLPADAYDARVYKVQQKLKETGYDPGQLDGILGSSTEQALRKFQLDHGLAETGRLDKATLKELNVAFAPQPDELDKFMSHLEFLGYEVKRDKKRILAKHPNRYNFYLRKLRGGFILSIYFKGTENSKKDKLGYLEFANSFNKAASVCRAYITDKGSFMCEAWFPGPYRKTIFSQFLDGWDKDIADHLKRDTQKTRAFVH